MNVDHVWTMRWRFLFNYFMFLLVTRSPERLLNPSIFFIIHLFIYIFVESIFLLNPSILFLFIQLFVYFIYRVIIFAQP